MYAPARRRDSAASIRSSGHPRNCAKQQVLCWVQLEYRNLGEYVYRCAVRLPARNSSDPGYDHRQIDGRDRSLKPAYGIWQELQPDS